MGTRRLAANRSLGGGRLRRDADLRHDVPAGIALTAILVPQGMAYATVAGLPPVHGLYTTVVALVAYALVGPSRSLVLGPDSSVSPMILAAVVPLLATDDPGRAVALAGMLAVLVGLLEVGFGLARIGVIASLFSRPVQIGYLNGVAVVVVASQLPTLLGYEGDAGDVVGQVADLAANLGDLHGPTVAVGVVSLAILLLTNWLPLAVPSVLVVVVGATLAVGLFDLGAEGVGVLGVLPSGIPSPRLPWTEAGDVAPLAVAALGIVLVSLADTVTTSASFAARHDEHVDADREIVAVGVANVAAGLFRGFAVSASSTRTAVAEEAGARSQLTGLVGAACVTLLLVAAPGLLRNLPDAALAAVVIVAALRLVDVGTLRRLGRVRMAPVVLSLAATAGVVFVGVLEGVLIAVGLSILVTFHRQWTAPGEVLGRVPGVRGWHAVGRHPEATTVPGVVLYRFEAPLFFANASRFREAVRDLVRVSEPPCHHLVLQCEAITDIDETAAEVLASLARELDAQGVQLVFVELRQRQFEVLSAYDAIGAGHTWRTYRSMKEALEAITGRPFDDLGLDRST